MVDVYEREVRVPLPPRSDGLARRHDWENYVDAAHELLNGQWKWEGYPSLYRPGWMEMQHPPAPTIYLHQDDPFPTIIWRDGTTQQVAICRGYPTEWRARIVPWTKDEVLDDDTVRRVLDTAFEGLAQWLRDGSSCCQWFETSAGWGGKLIGSDQQDDTLPAGGALAPQIALHGEGCPALLSVTLRPTAWRAEWTGLFGRVADPVYAAAGPAA